MLQHGFRLVNETYVPELSSTARLWSDERTGSQLLSFINTDENKVFGVSFRTPPADSTGVAHILEHSVLCGSEKYPVKEPFVELLKGSLQTFLNAFTYPDKTCYPVASANYKDFRNLTDVYLDAVFFPVISENIFKQEGWHIETEDEASPLIYKGVVYNEMKGAFSSPESLLGRYCLHALFPDTVYSLESGGDPEAIPSLTYKAFKHFHETYYHPSNARFFFWGDDPEEERLAQVGAVLARFSALQVDSGIGLQKPLTAPRSLSVPFAANEADAKGIVAVNWLGPDVMDIEATLAFQMLDHILLGMPASPLRRALIESGLGEDIAGQGLESELRQLIFDVGLKGIVVADAKKIENLILETLKGIVTQGISQDSIEAAINSVEFALRENNTGHFPVGLSVMLQALTCWLHGGDPLAPLQYEAPLASIKQKIAAGESVFEDLLQKWFINNPHRVTVILTPEVTLAAKQEQAEQERLTAIAASLDSNQRKALVEVTKALAEWQAKPDTQEALATIPRLRQADLPLTNATIPSAPLSGDVPCLFHGLPTGGIIYVEATFDLSGVASSLVPLLPLFGRALLEMGTKKYDFVDLNMTIARKTGGMDAGCLFMTALGSGESVERLVIEGKTTPDKLHDLFDLMAEVVMQCDFDQRERFLRMVREEKARLEHGLVPSGHAVVATRLKAGFTGAGWLNEATEGVSYLFSLRSLLERVEKDWGSVLLELTALRDTVFTCTNLLMNITALPEQEAAVIPLAVSFTEQLPRGSKPEEAVRSFFALEPAEVLLLPAQVNYMGKGVNLFDAGYVWHGSASVIIKYLRTGYLWERVRVQGGAYGCICGIDRAKGGFFMVSYRDPNVLPTLDVFDQTAGYLQTCTLSQRELESAIVGVIGELDTYLLPDAKGRVALSRTLAEETEERRQQLREEIFTTTQAHFRAFGESLQSFGSGGHILGLGGAALERVALENGWKTVQVL